MKFLVVVAIMAVIAVGIGYLGSQSEREGSQAVYSRIASLSDCAELQREFDQASANHDRAAWGSKQRDWSRGYMEAADDRMREIGCY